MKRINFEKIHLSYFLSCGEKVEHTFKNGVNLIYGQNNDSEGHTNGVGKTTIFYDSVVYALFGKTSKNITKNEVVHNIGNKHKCFVQLEFSIVDNSSTTKYKIIRSINPSKFILFQDGENISQSQSSATQEYLDKIIGTKFEVFKNSLMLQVNNTTSFLSFKKVEREKFINGIFDVEFIRDMDSLVRKDYNDLDKEVYKLKGEIESFNVLVQTKKANIKSKKENFNKLKIQYKNELEEFAEKQHSIKKQLSAIKCSSVENVSNQIKELEADIESKATTYNNNLVEINDKHNISLKNISDKSVNVIDELQQKSLLKRETFLREHQSKAQETLLEINNKDNEKVNLSKEYKSLKNDIKELEESKVCPTCKRAYDDLEAKTKKIESMSNRLLSIKKKGGSLSKALEVLNKQKDDFDSLESSKIKELEDEFHNKRSTILTKTEVKKTELEKKHSLNRSELEVEYKQLKTNLSEKLTSLKQELSKLNEASNRKNLLEQELKITINSEKKVSANLDTLMVEYKNEDLKSDLLKTLTDKRFKIKEVNKNKRSISQLEALKFILSDKGIRPFLLSKFVNVFNTKLNFYLERIQAPCTIEFDNEFGAKILNKNNKEISYESLSGGERKRVDVAIAFTFQDMLKLQNNIYFNLAIYDEIFDTSIDSVGIECIKDIIANVVGNDPNLNVYIITHRKDLDFESANEIFVEKNGGKSCIL